MLLIIKNQQDGFFEDFHQFICLDSEGCKLLKINSSYRTEAKIDGNNLHKQESSIFSRLVVFENITTFEKKLNMSNNQAFRQPEFLKTGDTIGIISTARKISKEEILPATTFFEKQGFKVIFGTNLFCEDRQFSGTDEQRASDLQEMFDNLEVKAVVCARGGYGTVRIIDKLDFSNFIQNPKWICGYSDVTVLHSHIHNLGIETLHSTMPLNFPKDGSVNESMKSLIRALKGEKLSCTITPHKFNRIGKSSGIICGGNLSILYSLNGTPSDIKTGGKILFIEDLDEYLYHIDRMMMNLKRSGKLAHLAGLIVGGMSDMNDNTIPFGKTAEEIVYEAVAEYNYPVCFGFPAGHIAENYALKFGEILKLSIQEDKSEIIF